MTVHSRAVSSSSINWRTDAGRCETSSASARSKNASADWERATASAARSGLQATTELRESAGYCSNTISTRCRSSVPVNTGEIGVPFGWQDCALIVPVSSVSLTGVIVPQNLNHPTCVVPIVIARTAVYAYGLVAMRTQLPCADGVALPASPAGRVHRNVPSTPGRRAFETNVRIQRRRGRQADEVRHPVPGPFD